MKRTIVLFLACAFCTLTSAQSITDKDIKQQGSAKKFKKVKASKLYIRNFRVFFEVDGSRTEGTSGYSGQAGQVGKTKTTLAVALTGLENSDFQNIADKAYQDFTKTMNSKGIEIVGTDVAGKTKMYEGWEKKTGGQLNYAQQGGYIVATPSNYAYFVRKTTKKGKERGTSSGYDAPGMKEFKLSNQMQKNGDDVMVATVNLYIDYLELKGSAWGAKAVVKAKLAFKFSGQSNATIAYGTGLNDGALIRLDMKDDIVSEQKVFKQDKIRESSNAESNLFPGYFTFIYHNEQKVTHVAEANHDAYVNESNRFINEFMTALQSRYFEAAGK